MEFLINQLILILVKEDLYFGLVIKNLNLYKLKFKIVIIVV